MPWAKMLADLIVVFHAAYVSFIVFGLMAILIGAVLRWKWVRNFWFRATHLTAIGIVVLETIFGITCPLTHWEQRLRIAAGEASYSGEFLGYWAHRLIFYDAEPWVFTMIYILFGVAVLGVFVVAPPRLPGRNRGRSQPGSVEHESVKSGA